MKKRDKGYLFFIVFVLPILLWVIYLGARIPLLMIGLTNLSGLDDIFGLPFLIITIILTLIAIIIYACILSFWNKNEQELQDALKNSGISQIENLSPFEFEEWVARLLRVDGYKANATKKSGDYGADVIAEKDGIKIAIQVKKFNKPVGIKAVQEVISAIGYYDCYEGWVITSSNNFTPAAHNLAKKHNIKLLNKNGLALMLNRLRNNTIESELNLEEIIETETTNLETDNNVDFKSTISYTAIKNFVEKDVVNMVNIVIKGMKDDNYADLDINSLPYIKDILDKGKDVCQKTFLKMTEENKKQRIEGFAIVALKWMTFLGMGAVYLYSQNDNFNTNDIYETISNKRGFLYIDEFVLDSFKMPYTSPEGLTFCNDLYDYSASILDLYMTETDDIKEDIANLTKCMLAMYIVGVSYATEKLK